MHADAYGLHAACIAELRVVRAAAEGGGARVALALRLGVGLRRVGGAPRGGGEGVIARAEEGGAVTLRPEQLAAAARVVEAVGSEQPPTSVSPAAAEAEAFCWHCGCRKGSK